MDSGKSSIDNSLRGRLLQAGCCTVVCEESVPSTNDHAMALSSQWGISDLPAIVTTSHQTRGRGRGQNSWWFGDGALAFSLLIEPSQFGISPPLWPTLSLAVGGAIATVIDRQFPLHNIRLKWPNDVFFNGRKGCGVLNETVPRSPERLVIGIGINVNNSLADAPLEVQQRATSLIDLAGAPLDRDELLIQIVEQLLSDWSDLAAGVMALPDRWRRLCLLSGSCITIEQSGERITGTCLGLENDGALRLQTANGPQRLYSGSVVDF